MKAKAVRLPEDMIRGIEWIGKREKLSKSGEALRRVVRLGLERDLAIRYGRGEISLREMAGILEVPVREALNILWEHGIPGNVTAETAALALEVARKLSRAHR
jgi:predicted HTH domain antitoxin